MKYTNIEGTDPRIYVCSVYCIVYRLNYKKTPSMLSVQHKDICSALQVNMGSTQHIDMCIAQHISIYRIYIREYRYVQCTSEICAVCAIMQRYVCGMCVVRGPASLRPPLAVMAAED